MRRRTPTAVAVLCGGGPADGERRPVEDGVDEILVDEPSDEQPVSPADAVRAHRYERRADGRFAYAGPVERLPQLPGALHDDAHAQGIAALGHDAGPSALSIIAMIVLVAVIMYCFGVYT